MSQFLAICLYFPLLIAYAIFCRKKALTQSDFVLGSRALSRWTTALAAHASEMSNWLFMAYPGAVFIYGGQELWVAIGLLLLMWVNWELIAPRIRKETEKTASLTLTGFFEQKLGTNWPAGRLVTSIVLFIFYTIYVSVTLCGMGFLFKTLFPLSYTAGVILGALLILPYVLIGGYITLAKVDFFQGIFLLSVILFVPLFITFKLGGVSSVLTLIYKKGSTFSLFASKDPFSVFKSLMLMLGWGIGYFGQPHILTKFMGIKNPKELNASKKIGMSWQFLSLLGATAVGFVGIAAFDSYSKDPEQIFIELVQQYFSPFVAGIFLCAIIAAIINTASSMLLILSTTIAEDFYKRFLRKNCSEREQLIVTRSGVVLSALLASGVALMKIATIDALVLYAWSGLGASFGPLVIMTLYSKTITQKGAWAGMLAGGGTVALWPLIGPSFVPSLIVAFPLALGVIWGVSKATQKTETALQN